MQNTDEVMCDNRAGVFRENCRQLVADIQASLGEDYFTKGEDVSFVELIPNGWDGEPTAALIYAGTTFFRDAESGGVVAAKRGGPGTSYAVLRPGMTEADLPWNFHRAVFSCN